MNGCGCVGWVRQRPALERRNRMETKGARQSAREGCRARNDNIRVPSCSHFRNGDPTHTLDALGQMQRTWSRTQRRREPHMAATPMAGNWRPGATIGCCCAWAGAGGWLSWSWSVGAKTGWLFSSRSAYSTVISLRAFSQFSGSQYEYVPCSPPGTFCDDGVPVSFVIQSRSSL